MIALASHFFLPFRSTRLEKRILESFHNYGFVLLLSHTQRERERERERESVLDAVGNVHQAKVKDDEL